MRYFMISLFTSFGWPFSCRITLRMNMSFLLVRPVSKKKKPLLHFPSVKILDRTLAYCPFVLWRKCDWRCVCNLRGLAFFVYIFAMLGTDVLTKLLVSCYEQQLGICFNEKPSLIDVFLMILVLRRSISNISQVLVAYRCQQTSLKW